MTQPEALRLADLLEERPHDALDFLPVKAADELRRLHAQRDALLELVVEMDRHEGAEGWSEDLRVKIDAVIAAVEEGENHAKNF